MKTAIFLAALFASIAAADTTYNCETSDASPYLHNVNEMIDNLNNADIGTHLCNPAKNGCGVTNTGYSGSGGAAFMICGAGMRCSGDPGGMGCRGGSGTCGGIQARMLGGYFETLRDKCQGPDSDGDIRVGGIVRQASGGDQGTTEIVDEMKLFSKPG